MSTAYVDQDEIEELEEEVTAAKKRLREARQHRSPEPVQDYELVDSDGGRLWLSDLFGAKDDLIVVHNVGTDCVYCTLWADGFTGLVPHLEDRAAFAVISHDTFAAQRRFAKGRGWNFKMVSAHGTDFAHAIGFENDDGFQPGVSTFRRHSDGQIYRIAKSRFLPGDEFCSIWSFLDLLDGGAKGWEPGYEYS